MDCFGSPTMNRRPGTGATVRQSVFAGSADAKQQEDLGLQGIGVLELVHENVCEPPLKSQPHGGVTAHQVAGLEQKVEKVEGPRALLRLFVPRNGGSELLLKRGREIRIRSHPELIEMTAETLECAEHCVACHARGVTGPAPVTRLREGPITREIHEPRFPAVVVLMTEGLMKLNLLAQMPGRGGIEKEVVFRIGR